MKRLAIALLFVGALSLLTTSSASAADSHHGRIGHGVIRHTLGHVFGAGHGRGYSGHYGHGSGYGHGYSPSYGHYGNSGHGYGHNYGGGYGQHSYGHGNGHGSGHGYYGHH